MRIKKLVKTILFVSTFAISLLGVAACNDAHEHTYSAWEVTAEATCSSHGLQKRVCECGYVEYETLATLSHTSVVDEAVGATCTTNGKTEGSHCSVCNAIIVAQTDTEKLAHSYSAWEVTAEATCTSHGLQKRACECGYTEYETVDKLEHAYSAWEVMAEATCTSNGLQKKVCVCGYAEYNTIDMKGHTPVVDEAQEVTCTTNGKTEGSHCQDCGLVLVAQEVIHAAGHSFGEAEIVTEATCALDGEKKISCINAGCGYSYTESYSLPELTHDEIYNKAKAYTGTIISFDRFGHKKAEGSAIVIGADGKILTSNKLMDNAYSATFTLGNDMYEVQSVLAYNAKNNLIMLKIDAENLPFTNVCAEEATAAETVYTVGAPSGFKASISRGIISHAVRVISGVSYIQHDADMSEGYLGGPLINRFGEVIGINIGYLGDDKLTVSVCAKELENLEYFEEEIALAVYGDITYTFEEELIWWISNFYTGKKNNTVFYGIQGSNFQYSLGLDTANNVCFVDGTWLIGEDDLLYARVYLRAQGGVYEYYASRINGDMKNETVGFFDAATYDETTLLTYDTYHGKYWGESTLMGAYSTAVYKTLGWFSYCLDIYFDRFTLEDCGFELLNYDRDENALDKLNAYVEANGEFDQETGVYTYSQTQQQSSIAFVWSIEYTPQNGETPASTVMNLSYYTASNSLYHVSISLNPTEGGNRFDAIYAQYDGTTYRLSNTTWGYIEADTFTPASKLFCYEFVGLEDYEDALLGDYATVMSILLDWANHTMTNISEELSVKDLGFLFYFG